jgi:hypothetical protein
LAKLNNNEQNNILKNKTELISEFKKKLSEDKDFKNSVSSATSGKAAVIKRFENIETLIKKYAL